MPQYQYTNEKTGETKLVIQRMTEPHTYSENGVEWKRVFTVPQGAVDTKIDAFSSKDFLEKSAKKRGTMGNLYDASREASLKREQIIGGKDPIKEKHYEDYSKLRKGKKHPDLLKKKTDTFEFTLGKP